MEERIYTKEEQERIDKLLEEHERLQTHRGDLDFAYKVFKDYWTTYCDNSPSEIEIERALRILNHLQKEEFDSVQKVKKIEHELRTKYEYYDDWF